MRALTKQMQPRRATGRKERGVLFRSAFCLLPSAFYFLLSAFCFSSSAFGGVWTKQQTGSLAWLHAVHFVDEQKGWAVGGKGALLSTVDGGLHWQLKKSPTEDALRDVYFADEQTGWLVCERNIYLLKELDEPRSYLLQTTDGGANWQRVEATAGDVDASLVRIVFADRERGFVFGELGALYATEDGGRTWARRRVPTRHLLLGGTFLDSQQGWIVGAGATLLQTSDGGATWREGRIENAALSQTSTPAAGATAPASSYLLVPAGANATPAAAPSNVATTTTTAREPRGITTRLNAVSFVDARTGWTVGAGGAIFATNDGGRTWRALSSPTAADLSDVKFFDTKEGWAVGTGGTVIHTTDGGASWRTERTNTTHPLERLFFTGRSRGWAVGFGGTIIAYAPNAPTNPAPRPKLRGVASFNKVEYLRRTTHGEL